ncbi:MAG: hypothetical protein ACRD96_24915, partial [Bryobacteraceae bacterium]
LTPRTLRLMNSEFVARLGSSIRAKMLTRVALPAPMRARMIEYCREDVRALQDVLHRDLSSWLR